MSKDKRVKGCHNLTCRNYRKEVKFKPTDNYCALCGRELVYVCANCFEKIEDMGPEVRLCKECDDKRSAKKEALKAEKYKVEDFEKETAKLLNDNIGKFQREKILKDSRKKAQNPAAKVKREISKEVGRDLGLDMS